MNARKIVDNRIDPSTLDTAALRVHIREMQRETDNIQFQLDMAKSGTQVMQAPDWLPKATHAHRSYVTAIGFAKEELAFRQMQESRTLDAIFVQVAREECVDIDFDEMMAEARKRMACGATAEEIAA